MLGYQKLSMNMDTQNASDTVFSLDKLLLFFF